MQWSSWNILLLSSDRITEQFTLEGTSGIHLVWTAHPEKSRRQYCSTVYQELRRAQCEILRNGRVTHQTTDSQSTQTQITKSLFSIDNGDTMVSMIPLIMEWLWWTGHASSSFLCWQTRAAAGCAFLLSSDNSKQSILPTHFCESSGFTHCLLKWVSLEGHLDVRCYLHDFIWVPSSPSFSHGHFGASTPLQSHSHQAAHYTSQQKQRQVWRALSIWALWTLSMLEGSQSPQAVTLSEECSFISTPHELHYQIKIKFIYIHFNRNIHISRYCSL